MTKLSSILALLIVMLTSTLLAQQDSYNEANNHYAAGRYEEAAQAYEKLITEDHLAADVYFNLGNAYFKMDNIPSAILNYERALKMKPDHEDALYNLAMANQKTVDKIERLPELFIGSTWRNLLTSRTVNSWAYYSVGLVFLALVFFVAYLVLQQRLLKKVNFYAGVFFFLTALFCWLMAAQHQGIINDSAEAIIFSPNITVQSGPNPTAEKLFTLHAGTKVNLLEVNNNWSKIKLPNGNVGWLESASLKEI